MGEDSHIVFSYCCSTKEERPEAPGGPEHSSRKCPTGTSGSVVAGARLRHTLPSAERKRRNCVPSQGETLRGPPGKALHQTEGPGVSCSAPAVDPAPTRGSSVELNAARPFHIRGPWQSEPRFDGEDSSAEVRATDSAWLPRGREEAAQQHSLRWSRGEIQVVHRVRMRTERPRKPGQKTANPASAVTDCGSPSQPLPALVPAAPGKAMMPHGRKHRLCKFEGGLQAQGEHAHLPAYGEEEATTAGCSPSALIQGTHKEEPAAGVPSPPENPHGASSSTAKSSSAYSQSDESSTWQEEEGRSTWQCLADTESKLRGALAEKMAELVRLLLLKYLRREPITVEGMLSCVTEKYEDYFPGIFCKAFECIHLIFGIEMKQADPTGHLYVLVPALGLTCHDVLGDDQSIPKTGLLIAILGIVFIGGGRVHEGQIWEALSVMGLFIGVDHCIYGEPRKLVTKDWVQAGYLEYRQASKSSNAHYEFLWGPRAHAETSTMRVLQYLAKCSRNDPRFHPSVKGKAVRDEEGEKKLIVTPALGNLSPSKGPNEYSWQPLN
ncbi:melanoma-associated antigen 8-like [Lepus europaeus]|uniref:melanoma-associated antigen 8-like n=1 Tax=Lepus europaeus TaxID=9983 RepID=UPI002B469A46|nr:melanoma-associated antigen 8-like [Lepus europaeus]